MKQNMSLNKLLANLITKTPTSSPADIVEETYIKNEDPTLKLGADLRRFLESESERLGLSLDQFIVMTLEAVKEASQTPARVNELDLMCDRFINVFSDHGIATADIPLLLPAKTLARSDLISKSALIDKIDDKLINSVANLFGLNTEWLKGISDQAYCRQNTRWYKSIPSFSRHLLKLTLQYHDIEVLFVSDKGLTYEKLKQATVHDDAENYLPMGVVIKMRHLINGVSYNKYEIFEYERWNYVQARYSLKYIMLFCHRTGIYFGGVLLDKKSRSMLFDGTIMPHTILNGAVNRWNPDLLLWNEVSNLEIDELSKIREYYKFEDEQDHGSISKYEYAIKYPEKIANLKDFMAGNPYLKFVDESLVKNTNSD